MIDDKWKSCISERPKKEDEYYVYISNLQVGGEIRIISYKNGEWDCILGEDEIIVAWKKIKKKLIRDEVKWLEEHHKEIQIRFEILEFDAKDFAIAETLEEGICKYNSWFHYGQIHKIDGMYVVRIVF